MPAAMSPSESYHDGEEIVLARDLLLRADF
jgi:hypothetical protein